MKRRSAAAKDLGTPKYRKRVIPNKKRQFIRNERKASMVISARRQLWLGPNE